MRKHRYPGRCKSWCSVHGLVPYPNLTLTERAPPALHLRSYDIAHLCVLIVGQCMRKHRCPGAVNVARSPGICQRSRVRFTCQDSVFY